MDRVVVRDEQRPRPPARSVVTTHPIAPPRRIRPLATGASVVLALAVTACGAPAAEQHEPSPSPGPAAATSAPPSRSTPATSPTVTRPRDPARYVGNPCSSLTAAQLPGLQARGPGASGTIQGHPGCHWQLGSAGEAGVSYGTTAPDRIGNVHGLFAAELYRQGYFEPVTIDGHPAAYTDTTDQRAAGKCVLAVAVTDGLLLTVVVDARTGTTSCTDARNVASAVLDTISAGA